MNELDLLKIRLENAIEGHKICMKVDPNRDTEDMLKLLQDCYSVICRIKPFEEDDLK